MCHTLYKICCNYITVVARILCMVMFSLDNITPSPFITPFYSGTGACLDPWSLNPAQHVASLCQEVTPHASCLKCLGESHQKECCKICKGFYLRTQKEMDQCLKILLMEAALHPRSDPGSAEPSEHLGISVQGASTNEGFCRYLEKNFSDLKKRGVVIGFDARAHPSSGSSSKRFARLAATTFISQGIPVYLFSNITPTPFVPYTITHLKLSAGIMITASHNPKQDNGYKVYWENGAQITSPHDKGISQAIEENQEPWPQAWDDSLVDSSLLLHDPYVTINKDYFKDIQKHCFHRNINKETKLKFVHTSVHGVGHEFVQSAFKAFDFKPPLAVAEQKDPDPEFPTVKYPNPEEGKGVLTLSFALAEKEGAGIILANDPDADRLLVAEKQESGEWKVFSGNELGALLGWWIFTCWKNQNQDSTAIKDVYMLSSTVSSKILRAIALKEGFHFEETLTGFKWMGNRAKQLTDQEKTVLFAFEEAIGYMCSPVVLDKDGVSAAVITAEMSSWLATKNLSLSQQLKAIYDEYGYHITKASYFICHDPKTIKELFENLRNYDGKNTYPKSCGKFKVSGVRDLTTGYDSSQPDQKAVLPTSKSSQMITFTFANGGVATMRTSGTEPKIKYYAELCAPPGNSDPDQLKKELDELVSAIEEYFFQPEKNKLQPKAE